MLVSWSSKKKNFIALSTTEAEYIDVGSCCAQIVWIKQQLSDFGVALHNIPIFCDNTSTINITKNLVQHSHTKHIEIRHHFIRDQFSPNPWMKINFARLKENLEWLMWMMFELSYLLNLFLNDMSIWWVKLYVCWTFSGAFMHFWVKWFESPCMWFESLFQNGSNWKIALNDSNHYFNDSN